MRDESGQIESVAVTAEDEVSDFVQNVETKTSRSP